MPATTEEINLYHELMAYTLAHRDPAFIHQHVVDAWGAQQTDESTKAIGLVFALVGLYLYVEKGFSGRQVQRVHMQMGRLRKAWVKPPLSSDRGGISVRDVMAAEPGPARDAMIHTWCESVWSAWSESRSQIVALTRNELGVS